jgi:putative membrane protein
MRHRIGALSLAGGFILALCLTAAAGDEKDKAKPDKTVKTEQGDKHDSKAAADDFFKKAASGGLLEVQTSRFATEQSTSDEVKKFAKQMMADHGKANQELLGLGAKKGFRPPVGLLPKHAEILKKVGEAKVGEFDATFAKTQVDAHDEAVKLFESQAKDGADADFKSWAEKTLPTLRDHLKMAQHLADSVGKSHKGDGEAKPGSKTGKERD